MRDIGLTRRQAEKQLEVEWGDVKRYGGLMVEREAKLAHDGRGSMRDDEWLKLEGLKLAAVLNARDIERSGVIPWIKNDVLGTLFRDMDVWVARVLKRNYTNRDTVKYDPVIVVNTETGNSRQSIVLDRDTADKLLEQLGYELEKWEQS